MENLLREIDEFQNTCYMFMKISAGDFAKENFSKLVDEENLNKVKDMLEANKKLNEIVGNSEAAQVITTFQEGWFNKL